MLMMRLSAGSLRRSGRLLLSSSSSSSLSISSSSSSSSFQQYHPPHRHQTRRTANYSQLSFSCHHHHQQLQLQVHYLHGNRVAFFSASASPSPSSLDDEDQRQGDDNHHNDDDETITTTTTTQIQRRHKLWSLQQLADIDTWDHPQMDDIIEDIALRLQYQSELLERLSEYLTQIRTNPMLASSSSSSSNSSNNNNSNTTTTTTTMLRRPYWWTHRQELQLLQEIETQQSQLRNLQRLYSDTHDKIKSMTMKKKQQQNQTNQQQQCHHDRFFKFRLFGEIYARHALTIETLAEMVIGLRPLQRPSPKINNNHTDMDMDMDMDDILQHILLQERLGMLLLCDHVTLSCSTKVTSTIPIVSVDIPDVVEKAVTEASHLCQAQYLTAPAVEITTEHRTTVSETSHNNNKNDDSNNRMMMTKNNLLVVKPWLQYTLVELFKNNMAITVERHIRAENDNNTTTTTTNNNNGDDDSIVIIDDDPERERFILPIHVYITETLEEIRIDIHDQGGGIIQNDRNSNDDDNSSLEHLFEFAQRRTKWDRMDDQQTYAMTRSPLRGLGVGLSMSRMMMEYFGGSLTLKDRRRSAVSSSSSSSSDDTTTNNNNTTSLEAGVTATIVLPKDTTILEKQTRNMKRRKL